MVIIFLAELEENLAFFWNLAMSFFDLASLKELS